MHVTMSVEDMTHENYWRQLLRWLVDGVPDHVEAHTNADRVEAGEPVTVTAAVVDPTFVEINDAHVVAHVTGPKGPIDVPLQWTGEKSGQYRGTFVAADEGVYTAQVEATRADKPLGTGAVQLRAAPGDAEYFDATMQEARLRRIAEETGGRFYTPPTMSALPEDRQLQRPRHHDGRRARPLAHADRPGAAAGADVRRVGLSPSGGTGVGKEERRKKKEERRKKKKKEEKKKKSACGPSEAPEGSRPEAGRRVSASGGGAPRALRKEERLRPERGAGVSKADPMHRLAKLCGVCLVLAPLERGADLCAEACTWR